MGYKYLDIADTALAAVEAVLKRAYTSQGLERVAEGEKAFKHGQESRVCPKSQIKVVHMLNSVGF
jgi:hypothetical protein